MVNLQEALNGKVSLCPLNNFVSGQHKPELLALCFGGDEAKAASLS